MHGNRFYSTFILLKKLTKDEFSSFKDIIKNVFELSKEINNYEINIPCSSLLKCGPRSGYLSSLFNKNGSFVITFEVSKGLFIWQNFILKKMGFLSNKSFLNFFEIDKRIEVKFDLNKAIQIP